MNAMTLREKIAQMVVPRLDGPRLGDAAYFSGALRLAESGVGGFILFGGDTATTPKHLAELQSRAKVPLIISSDVERGLGQQLAGGTRFPGQRAVASAVNPRSAKDRALLDRMLEAVRAETRAAGIHAVYSPVVDVNNNPDNPIICTRAFGDEPGVVEWFGARYIAGLQKPSAKNRISLLACAKHFPGHGDTDQDSHSVLPVIRADRPRLNRVELPPFREAVKDGVAMVMVAHLFVPALDPEKPTTFSKKTVTALLREGMEFNGLIVSDALDMGALANEYSQEDIAVRAVEAGIDVLLHPKDAADTISFVLSAVDQGRLTEQRITESVERIMAAKKRLGLLDANPPVPPFSKGGRRGDSARGKEKEGAVPGAIVDDKKHREIARELAAAAPRIVRGRRKTLPLDADKGVACFILDDDAAERTGSALLAELSARFAGTSGTVLTPQAALPVEHLRQKVSGAAGIVIALFSKISASKGRSGMAEDLLAAGLAIMQAAKKAGRPVIAVSFDSPYILDRFTGADALIAAYDRMDEIQQAVAGMIAGA